MNARVCVAETLELLERGGYFADRGLATCIGLCLSLERPLFLEGEAGVGKTEVAKVLANTLDRRLIRLQCYEGLDVSTALYEWNYARQMVEIRLAEATKREGTLTKEHIFSRDFLIERPLLQALNTQERSAPVLLIDELDRADEPFEAFLLEILSDFQVSIPELGVIRAAQKPIVVITSNRTREIHDAIKRRCFYHWLDYPDSQRELRILRRKASITPHGLASQVVHFVAALRRLELFKRPGVAETIDWAEALSRLAVTDLTEAHVEQTLGVLLKYQDDIELVCQSHLQDLIAQSNVDGMFDPN